MRVAAIQFAPVFLDKVSNLHKIARLVSQAAQEGAKIVVLPELCTTGYSFLNSEQARAQAEPITTDARTTSVMMKLAAHFDIALAWGMVESDLGTGTLYNAQVLATPRDGYVSYRKANLWGNDFLWAKAGRASPPVLRTSLGLIAPQLGLTLCRDVRNKTQQVVDFYEPGDADLVLMSANWGRGGFPATAWMDFVSTNKIPLVVANRWGLESHNDFGQGGSCIIHADGQVDTDGLVMGSDCIVTGDLL